MSIERGMLVDERVHRVEEAEGDVNVAQQDLVHTTEQIMFA